MESSSKKRGSRFKRTDDEIYNDSAKVACEVPPYIVQHKLWSWEDWEKKSSVKLKKEIESICNISRKQLEHFMESYYSQYAHEENIHVECSEEVDEDTFNCDDSNILIMKPFILETSFILNRFEEILRVYQTMNSYTVDYSSSKYRDRVTINIVETKIAYFSDINNKIKIEKLREYMNQGSNLTSDYWNENLGEGAAFYAARDEKATSFSEALLQFIYLRNKSDSGNKRYKRKRNESRIGENFDFFLLEIPMKAQEAIETINPLMVATWMYSWVRLILEGDLLSNTLCRLYIDENNQCYGKFKVFLSRNFK
jgi:hypothetical protein